MRQSSRIKGSPAFTVVSGLIKTSFTVPSPGAATSCSIYIAERTQSTCPDATFAPGSTRTETTIASVGAVSSVATSSIGTAGRAALAAEGAPADGADAAIRAERFLAMKEV